MLIAGVDEAGRGPLAGPVIAAAVILDPKHPIAGLKDSKTLSASARQSLAKTIQDLALSVAIGRAEVDEIDRLNILQASLVAMRRAVMGLSIQPEKILVDGSFVPEVPYPAEAIIKGDRLVEAISAASIVAKVTRDQEMQELDKRFPGYGFAQHKGYPTQLHYEQLKRLGPCSIHRRSFAPVKALYEETS